MVRIQPGELWCDYNKYIEVAHKIPVSKFGLDTKISVINNIDNLIGLCRNHHWEFDHKDKTEGSNKITKTEYKCVVCGNTKKSKTPYCAKCGHICIRRVKQRSSIEVLEKETKVLGFCGAGRKYGVSDNAIRKWLRN